MNDCFSSLYGCYLKTRRESDAALINREWRRSVVIYNAQFIRLLLRALLLYRAAYSQAPQRALVNNT